jgi:hypothetical protein
MQRVIDPHPPKKEPHQHQPMMIPLEHLEASNNLKTLKPEIGAHQVQAHAMKASPNRPMHDSEEDDIEFEVPGERSERQHRDLYSSREDQDSNRQHRNHPADFQKVPAKSEFQPSKEHDSYFKNHSEFAPKRIAHLDDRDTVLANLKVPEESNDHKLYSDHRSHYIDPQRLDLLEEDEPVGLVPVTSNFMNKKAANIHPAVSDNGEFKKFYEENKHSKMSLIKEEPNEVESDNTSPNKHQKEIHKEHLLGSSHLKNPSLDSKEAGRRSEYNKHFSPVNEISNDSNPMQKQMPIVSEAKFISPAHGGSNHQEIKVFDDRGIAPAIKIKESSKISSFPKLQMRHEEEVFSNFNSNFKGPSPTSLWDPSKHLQSLPFSQTKPQEHHPAEEIKREVPLPLVSKPPQDALYTKEEVDKMIEDKMKYLNEGYTKVVAEVARLSASLNSKKEEDSVRQAKINESTFDNKPKSSIRLLAPSNISLHNSTQHQKNLALQGPDPKKSLQSNHHDTMAQTFLLDNSQNGNSDTIQKIVAFARGTNTVNRIDPLIDTKGVLYENDDLLIEIEFDKDLSVKDGRFYLKSKLTFTNRQVHTIAGIAPKLVDDEGGKCCSPRLQNTSQACSG